MAFPSQLSPYQHFCHSVLLPLGDRLTRHHVHRGFRHLLNWQWSSLQQIEDHRLQRLRSLMRHSLERVPYYKRVFADRSIDATTVDRMTVADLSQLPVLTKSDVFANFEDMRVPAFSGTVHEMKSSGSTGQQTTVLIDRRCFNEIYSTQLLFWSWGGFAMGAPHIQTGMSLNRAGLKRLKDVLLRCTYVSAFDLTDARLSKLANEMKRGKIRYLFGYASSLFVIANYLAERGECWGLNGIFTWGDSLFPHYRQLIESVFQCRVNDCYGLGEGLQVAAQCEVHGALHEAMHGVIVEIVDAGGDPVEVGELGRVVVTRLEPGPMPLIRYDTGDVAAFVGGDCPCGRRLQRMTRIQGRATDIVSTPAGDRLIVHYFTQIFEMVPGIAQFQVRQDVPTGITILFVRGRGFHQGILDSIESEIRDNCNYPLNVEFQEVSQIPLEKSNKRRFVISKVPFGTQCNEACITSASHEFAESNVRSIC